MSSCGAQLIVGKSSTMADSGRFGIQAHSADQQTSSNLVHQQHQQHQQQPQLRNNLSEKQPSECEPLQCSRILISMASIGIAAYFLTSGIMQLTFAQFGITLCSVSFGKDDPSSAVTWLVASCWLTGLMRFLLSVCIGRPPYNRSVWSEPSKHRGFSEQMAALAFLPDVRPRSRDMSVLDRAQLAAGIIHPAFYHRTLLVAWQEGLLVTLWLILHMMRLLKLSEIFSNNNISWIRTRDGLLDQAFGAMGSNFTVVPLSMLGKALQIENITKTANLLKSTETLNRLASHTCELISASAADLFFTEDCWLLALLGLSLLLLPMLSRMLKFFYSR